MLLESCHTDLHGWNGQFTGGVEAVYDAVVAKDKRHAAMAIDAS